MSQSEQMSFAQKGAGYGEQYNKVLRYISEIKSFCVTNSLQDLMIYSSAEYKDAIDTLTQNCNSHSQARVDRREARIRDLQTEISSLHTQHMIDFVKLGKMDGVLFRKEQEIERLTQRINELTGGGGGGDAKKGDKTKTKTKTKKKDERANEYDGEGNVYESTIDELVYAFCKEWLRLHKSDSSKAFLNAHKVAARSLVIVFHTDKAGVKRSRAELETFLDKCIGEQNSVRLNKLKLEILDYFENKNYDNPNTVRIDETSKIIMCFKDAQQNVPTQCGSIMMP